MKVVVDNFSYKGKYYDKFECELPVSDLNSISSKELSAMFTEQIDIFEGRKESH